MQTPEASSVLSPFPHHLVGEYPLSGRGKWYSSEGAPELGDMIRYSSSGSDSARDLEARSHPLAQSSCNPVVRSLLVFSPHSFLRLNAPVGGLHPS